MKVVLISWVSWWWLGAMGLYRVLSGGLVLESISISSSWARRAASCTEAESTGWSQASSQPSATQPHLASLASPGLTCPHSGSLISSGDPCKHPRVPLPQRGKGDGHWEARAVWVQDPGPTAASTSQVTPSPFLEQSSSSLRDPTTTLWGLHAQALLFQELNNPC